jgi:hypothetical protein
MITAARRRQSSCGVPEIAQLGVQGSPEGRAGGAALDVGRQARVGDEIGKDAQHCRHHQIAGGKFIAVEIPIVGRRLLVTPAWPTPEGGRPLLHANRTLLAARARLCRIGVRHDYNRRE